MSPRWQMVGTGCAHPRLGWRAQHRLPHRRAHAWALFRALFTPVVALRIPHKRGGLNPIETCSPPSRSHKSKIGVGQGLSLLQSLRGGGSPASSSFWCLQVPQACVRISSTSPPSSHCHLSGPVSPLLSPKDTCHWICGPAGQSSMISSQGPSRNNSRKGPFSR